MKPFFGQVAAKKWHSWCGRLTRNSNSDWGISPHFTAFQLCCTKVDKQTVRNVTQMMALKRMDAMACSWHWRSLEISGDLFDLSSLILMNMRVIWHPVSWLFLGYLILRIQSAVHFGDPKYMPGRRSVDGELRKMAASQHSEVWELDTFETFRDATESWEWMIQY